MLHQLLVTKKANIKNKMKGIRGILVVVGVIAFMAGCTVNPRVAPQTEEEKEADSLKRYLMLEEIPDSAIENIRNAIATADTLTEEYDYRSEDEDIKFDKKAFELMKRAMMKTGNYEGPYIHAYHWACEDTVKGYFLDYLNRKGVRVKVLDSLHFQKAVDTFEPILENYCASAQYEINTAAYIHKTMQMLKAIGTYKEIASCSKDTVLAKAYFVDYALWDELIKGVCGRNEGGYSMYGLEVNSYGEEMLKLRYNLLQEELALLRSGKPCRWDASAHKPDWSASDSDLLRVWYDKRMEYANKISDKAFAENFRIMTEKAAFLFPTIHFDIEEIMPNEVDDND